MDNLLYSFYRYSYDWTYILVILGAVLSLIASIGVNATFKAYSRYGNRRGITSQQAAQYILQSAGIYDVRIERVRGALTDHYSPREKVLRLSDSVYGSNSIAAIGVAAHECGHAIQHKVGYKPLGLRSAAVPIANIGSKLAWPVVILGLVLGYVGLAKIGVFLFLFVVAFQLITLPVEFNASNRALKVLAQQNILAKDELKGARKVLSSAAMTYVAAVITSILQLLRLILLVGGGRRRRR